LLSSLAKLSRQLDNWAESYGVNIERLRPVLEKNVDNVFI
jgi:hypothetical protein